MLINIFWDWVFSNALNIPQKHLGSYATKQFGIHFIKINVLILFHTRTAFTTFLPDRSNTFLTIFAILEHIIAKYHHNLVRYHCPYLADNVHQPNCEASWSGYVDKWRNERPLMFLQFSKGSWISSWCTKGTINFSMTKSSQSGTMFINTFHSYMFTISHVTGMHTTPFVYFHSNKGMIKYVFSF